MFKTVAIDQRGTARAFGYGHTKKEATRQCNIIVQEYKSERPDLTLTTGEPFKLDNS